MQPTFRQVPPRASLPSLPTHFSTQAVFFDYDLDGDLDLFVTNFSGQERLYRNNGTGTFTLTSGVIPGDGSAPIVAILRKLAEKQYAGPLSVELFLMELQQGDPFDVASRIKQKCEAVMRQAGVL